MTAPSGDQSEGSLPPGKLDLLDTRLGEQGELRKFRRVLFWGLVGTTAVFYLTLLAFVLCRHPHERGDMAAMTVLGLIPTVLSVMLLRFVADKRSAANDDGAIAPPAAQVLMEVAKAARELGK